MFNNKTEYEKSSIQTFKNVKNFHYHSNVKTNKFNEKNHDIFLSNNSKYERFQNNNKKNHKEFIPNYMNKSPLDQKLNNLYNTNYFQGTKESFNKNMVKNKLLENDLGWNNNKYSSKYDKNYNFKKRQNEFFSKNQIFDNIKFKPNDINSNKSVKNFNIINLKEENKSEKPLINKNKIEKVIKPGYTNDKQMKIQNLNFSDKNPFKHDKKCYNNNSSYKKDFIQHNKNMVNKSSKAIKTEVLKDNYFGNLNNHRYQKSKEIEPNVIKNYDINIKDDQYNIKKKLNSKGYEVSIKNNNNNINGSLKNTQLEVKWEKNRIENFEKDLNNLGYNNQFKEVKAKNVNKKTKYKVNFHEIDLDWTNKFLENKDSELVYNLKNAKTPLEKKIVVNYKSHQIY